VCPIDDQRTAGDASFYPERSLDRAASDLFDG
jgi:hypothetical protein